MRIKFEGRRYKVNFRDGVDILYKQGALLCKRQKRRAQQIFERKDLLLYGLITFCWILFGVALHLISQYRVTDIETEYSAVDTILKIIEPYFASVFLAFIISAVTRAEGYRKKIRAQHNLYVATMADFQRLVTPFIGEERLYFHPFYCDKCFNDTVEFIERRGFTSIIVDSGWRTNLAMIAQRVLKVENSFVQEDIVMYSFWKELLPIELDDATFYANKFWHSSEISVSEIIAFSRILLKIVDCIREPWRVDIEDKLAILKMLEKYPEHEINENFFYKMLLNGHAFDFEYSNVI